MKNLARRDFIRHLFMGLAAAPIATGTVKVFAQEINEDTIQPVSGIQIRNPHGHVLELAIADLLKLSLGEEESMSFNIQ